MQLETLPSCCLEWSNLFFWASPCFRIQSIHVLYLNARARHSTNESFSLLDAAYNNSWQRPLLYFAGSRMNKQWFLVRDSKQEINAVLTMVPWSLQCTLTFNKATRKTLKELFSLLQVCIMYNVQMEENYMHMSRTPKFVNIIFI